MTNVLKNHQLWSGTEWICHNARLTEGVNSMLVETYFIQGYYTAQKRIGCGLKCDIILSKRGKENTETRKNTNLMFSAITEFWISSFYKILPVK